MNKKKPEKKNKNDKPSFWETIKILWKIERDMKKTEKRSRKKRR